MESKQQCSEYDRCLMYFDTGATEKFFKSVPFSLRETQTMQYFMIEYQKLSLKKQWCMKALCIQNLHESQNRKDSNEANLVKEKILKQIL